jgi:hypothetical protein
LNDALLLFLLNALAQIEVESFWQLKTHFCWCKKATEGSSFCAVQKGFKTTKLATNSWMSFK